MTPPLVQLVYLSSARQEFGAVELRALLEVARRNNERRGVTGLLLYGGGSFVQFLEGPPDAVDQTYAIIRADPRHGGCTVLLRRPVAAPDFATWSMAFRDVAQAGADAAPILEGFNALLQHRQVQVDEDMSRPIQILIASFHQSLFGRR